MQQRDYVNRKVLKPETCASTRSNKTAKYRRQERNRDERAKQALADQAWLQRLLRR